MVWVPWERAVLDYGLNQLQSNEECPSGKRSVSREKKGDEKKEKKDISGEDGSSADE